MKSLGTIVLALAATCAAASDLPQIVERGSLRVLASADESPSMFNWEATGQPGFEREMLDGFARLHKLTVTPVRVERFDTIIPALLADEGDLIVGIIDTAERRQKIAFTSETLPARHLVVTRKPHRVVESASQLADETVGTVQGTTWWKAALAAGVPESKLKPFPTRDEMLAALASGGITATVMSLSDFTLELREDPGLQGGAFVGDRLSAAWGVRQQDRALKQALDEYLANLRRTPTWSRLIVKYFGDDALAVLGRASEK